jgi:hypothetical protein
MGVLTLWKEVDVKTAGPSQEFWGLTVGMFWVRKMR